MARATLEVGDYGRLDVKAAGSMPVSDNFYIGGSVAYLSRDGYGEVVAKVSYRKSGTNSAKTFPTRILLGRTGQRNHFDR